MQYRKLFRCFDKPKKSQNVLDFIQGVPRNMTVDEWFCLLPYIILDDIKDFFQFISLTNSLTQIYFTLKSIF